MIAKLAESSRQPWVFRSCSKQQPAPQVDPLQHSLTLQMRASSWLKHSSSLQQKAKPSSWCSSSLLHNGIMHRHVDCFPDLCKAVRGSRCRAFTAKRTTTATAAAVAAAAAAWAAWAEAAAAEAATAGTCT